MTVRAVHGAGRTHGRAWFRGWLASRGALRRVGRWQLCAARCGPHHAPGAPGAGARAWACRVSHVYRVCV